MLVVLLICQLISNIGRQKVKLKQCIKCKANPPIIQIRHTLYCHECFLFATTGKFLRFFQQNFSLNDDYPAFYIGVSGGPSSRFLLHCLHSQLSPRKGKGNFVRSGIAKKLVVIHVDHSKVVPGARNVRKEIEDMVKDFPQVEIISIDLSTVWSNPSSISAHLSGFPGQPPASMKTDNTTNLFDKSLSSSSLEYNLSFLTHHIILREARRHADGIVGKDQKLPLFLGTNATRVTIKLLSSMSRGRGWSLGSGEVQTESTQYGMRVLQPLLNHSSKEIGIFNKFVIPQSSQSIINPTFSTFAAPKSSIDRLTEELVVTLERGFPSTVSTVARTGNKISFAGNEKEAERLCTLCGWPARSKANEWKDGIAITSIQPKDNQKNDQNSNEHNLIPALSDILCYGCYTNLTDSRARSETNYSLPSWTDDYVKVQKVSENVMRSQFEDCLIDNNNE